MDWFVILRPGTLDAPFVGLQSTHRRILPGRGGFVLRVALSERKAAFGRVTRPNVSPAQLFPVPERGPGGLLSKGLISHLTVDPANRDRAMSQPYPHDLAGHLSAETFLMNSVLPECLEQVDGGIRITGHRVSLFRILDAIFDGVSIERMSEMFPTIPPCQLSDVVTFCNQQIEVMRSYHVEQRASFAALTADRVTEGPSFRRITPT